MRRQVSRKIGMGLFLGLLASVIIILVTEILLPQIFDNFEAKTLDWRYRRKIERLWNQRQGSLIDDIIIVDVDNRSLNKLGRYDQWSREYHAQIIDYISSGGAAAISFDILFMERDVDRRADSLFAAATQRAGNVFHVMSFSRAEPDAFLYKMEKPPPGFKAEKHAFLLSESVAQNFESVDRFDGKFMELYNNAAGLGFANFYPDNDSVIRRMPLFINFAGRQYPTIGFAIILYLLGVDKHQIKVNLGKAITMNFSLRGQPRQFRIPVDSKGRMLINYMGFFQTFRYVSYYDVLMKRIPAQFFENRVVLVGASAAGLYDLRPVPFQSAFPGTEIHANIIYNILTQNFVHKASPLWTYAILIGLALIVGLTTMFLRLYFNIPLALLVIALYVTGSFVAFQNENFWIETVRPVFGIIICYLSVIAYRYVDEQRDKRKIKGMFQHYISATVVNELLKNPDMLKLGGERKVATAFFSDIKSFTTISENLTPEELISVLNEYLSAMTDIVLKYEGYLDKYEGDAIVAIFGIPVEQTDHAARACFAALEMQRELIKLREKWRAEGRPMFEARIGINSGPMIAGNIGGKERFDYTAIGDSVNLASRLEGANKMYGTNIMISEDTYRQVEDKIVVRELDFIRVKGKTRPVRIYEVLARKSDRFDTTMSKAMKCFARGLKIYRQRNWSQAIDEFQKVLKLRPDDGPSLEFIRRCHIFIENPRPADWDGVFELRSK